MFVLFDLSPIIRPPSDFHLGLYFARPFAIIAGLCLVVVVTDLFGKTTPPIADGAGIVPELHRLTYLFVLRWGYFDDMFLCTHSI